MSKFTELIKENRVLVVLIIIVLVLAGSGLYLWERKSYTKPQIEPFRLVKTEKSREEAAVEITRTGFVPQTIRLRSGGMINFINKDTNPHQIMSDPHPGHTLYPFLNTDEVLNKDGSVALIFEKSGTYTYHDHLNPLEYQGTVIVE